MFPIYLRVSTSNTRRLKRRTIAVTYSTDKFIIRTIICNRTYFFINTVGLADAGYFGM